MNHVDPDMCTAYGVIMAGGSGERFWPLSRANRPKQLLPLGADGQTMLEEAIRRIEPVIPLDRILIITGGALRNAILDELPWFPADNVVAEPAKRNTAPCLALAAAIIEARHTHAQAHPLMAVLTADHFIGDEAEFRRNVETALNHACSCNSLVTLGVQPSRPETGYGYIEVEDHTSADSPVKQVKAFREKPDAPKALEYMRGGNHLWNSGMFFWRVDVFIEQMQKHLPDVGNAIRPLASLLRNSAGHTPADDELGRLAALFTALPNVSIDYGLMEKADSVAVVPVGFVWDDVGSWDSLYRLRNTNDNGTVHQGTVIDVESTNCVLINAADSSHVLATVGVQNVIVVVTPDATLVCAGDKAQQVRDVVRELRSQGRTDVI